MVGSGECVNKKANTNLSCSHLLLLPSVSHELPLEGENCVTYRHAFRERLLPSTANMPFNVMLQEVALKLRQKPTARK